MKGCVFVVVFKRLIINSILGKNWRFWNEEYGKNSALISQIPKWQHSAFIILVI